MDERQTQITEGAGLEESRINREFIDALQKWSTPVLLVILLIAGAYAGVNWLDQRQRTQLDAAFVAFRNAEMEGRPEALLDVAREHAGRGSVALVARLSAADMQLQSYHLRVRPGTQGLSDEDQLSEAEAMELLDEAGRTYAEVYDKASGRDGLELFAISGRWGAAAVALSKRDFDAAEAALEDVRSMASEHGLTSLAERAARTLESMPELRAQPELAESLPAAPASGAEPPVGATEGDPAGPPPAGPAAETDGDADAESDEPESPGEG